MGLPEVKMIIGEKYSKEQIESLGLTIKKQVHIGLICRKDEYLYFFEVPKPQDPKLYTLYKVFED